MIKQKVREIIKKCDKQLDNLYVHLGKFLYDNIEKENLYYCFKSKDKQLEEQAEALLIKIKYSSKVERKM